MAQCVFTMKRAGKIVPPKRQILKDTSLSFFPGARIGVLGLNGSGKSSLPHITAGVAPPIGSSLPWIDRTNCGTVLARAGRGTYAPPGDGFRAIAHLTIGADLRKIPCLGQSTLVQWT